MFEFVSLCWCSGHINGGQTNDSLCGVTKVKSYSTVFRFFQDLNAETADSSPSHANT